MNERTTGSQAIRLANQLGRPGVYLPILMGIFLVFIPLLGVPVFIVHVLIVVFITGIAAVAWNIIGGFGGQFSLGNAVFFGFGAYSTGILMTEYDQLAWVGIAIGILISIIAAIIIGYPTFQLEGHYFALATIAIVEGMFALAQYFGDITGGSQGLSIFADYGWGNLIFRSRSTYYYLILSLFVIAILISIWVRYSRLGYFLLAIREDEEAAEAIGVNVTRYKLYGFILSAALTGLAGGFHAVYIQFLSPGGVFSLDESILYALIVLIGGMGTIWGPVLGTFLLVSIQTYATTVIGGNIGALSYVAYGVLLIVLIIYAPNGLINRFQFVGERICDVAPAIKIKDNAQN